MRFLGNRRRMDCRNILIVASENSQSLVGALQNTIRLLGVDSMVYTCDMAPGTSSASKVSDGSFAIPRLTSEDYMQVLQSICLGNHVKMVIPTTERELPILSANMDIFAKLGIHILTPDYEFVMKCIDNHNFSGYLNTFGININMLEDIVKYETLVDMYFTNEFFAELIVRKYLLNERVDYFDA